MLRREITDVRLQVTEREEEDRGMLLRNDEREYERDKTDGELERGWEEGGGEGGGRRGEWGRRVRSRGEPAQSGFTVSSCKLYDCGISEGAAATRPPRVLLFSREERNYLRSVVINLACLESDMDFLIGNGSFPNFQVLFIFIA